MFIIRMNTAPYSELRTFTLGHMAYFFMITKFYLRAELHGVRTELEFQILKYYDSSLSSVGLLKPP